MKFRPNIWNAPILKPVKLASWHLDRLSNVTKWWPTGLLNLVFTKSYQTWFGSPDIGNVSNSLLIYRLSNAHDFSFQRCKVLSLKKYQKHISNFLWAMNHQTFCDSKWIFSCDLFLFVICHCIGIGTDLHCTFVWHGKIGVNIVSSLWIHKLKTMPLSSYPSKLLSYLLSYLLSFILYCLKLFDIFVKK